jgi:hypothetical protein
VKINRISLAKQGEKNPSFKGDKAGYGAIHAWVRRRKIKPALCERCRVEPPRDLANKTGKYLRDLSDWEYLCRRCHMNSDDRNERLRISGKSRKIPNRLCKGCGIEYHPVTRSSQYHNRGCYMQHGGSHHKEKVHESLAN